MYIVLLSGGSGKRLWPLSNDLCSKQYIKLMNHDTTEDMDEKCSMLQRVFGQLKTAGLSVNKAYRHKTDTVLILLPF